MFLPVEDEDVSRHLSVEELGTLRRKDWETAEKRVHEALGHWVKFFEKSDKYIKVGTVKREDGWLDRLPRRALCKQAQKARPKRVAPGGRVE